MHMPCRACAEYSAPNSVSPSVNMVFGATYDSAVLRSQNRKYYLLNQPDGAWVMQACLQTIRGYSAALHASGNNQTVGHVCA